MPAKPSAAALRRASTGNSSRASQPGACGSHSSTANWRAVSWKARCSSERVKSIDEISALTPGVAMGLADANRKRGFCPPAPMLRWREEQGEYHADKSGSARGGHRPIRRAGGGAEEWRDPQIFSPRQPGEHVDPRRGDDLDRGADDERLQQPDPVQSARKAKPAGIHPAGTGRELVVEPGFHAAELQIAPGRQMA